MAENRVTIGDREGVIVRTVGMSDGIEYTVRVPHDQDALEDVVPASDPHALILDGHGNTSNHPERYDLTVDEAVARNEELREQADADDEQRREEKARAAADGTDAPASQKPAGSDKPLTAGAKAAADNKAKSTTTKAADRK